MMILIFNSGIFQMFLRNSQPLLTVKLAIRCPSQQGPAKKSVLRVRKRKTADCFLEFVPFILRINVKAAFESAENNEALVGIRRNALAKLGW